MVRRLGEAQSAPLEQRRLRVPEDEQPVVTIAGEDEHLVARDVRIVGRIGDDLDTPEVIALWVEVAADLDELKVLVSAGLAH